MTYLPQSATTHYNSDASVFAAFRIFVSARMKEMKARMKIRASLGGLSDRQLRDVGLTRNDIDAIEFADLPASSAEFLSKQAAKRSRNW